MPYSAAIDERIKTKIMPDERIGSKKIFGGTCYLVSGNMFCGVYRDYLILRLPESEAKEVLAIPGARPFDITGKPMKGWVMIREDHIGNDEMLARWLAKARAFAEAIPPKKKKADRR